MNNKYYRIRDKYLAESMAFLDFKYMKFGFGKDTVYSFENTELFKTALERILELKKDIQQGI